MISQKRVRQVYIWHKWTGLITGLFIFFVSVTGALAVFKKEIEAWLNPGMTIPAQAGKPLPIENILKTVKRDFPETRINAITLAVAPHETHRLGVRVDGKNKRAFINPYTGAVTGYAQSGVDIADIIRQSHLRFYFFGWKGRIAVGIVGLALVLSTVTGFMLYGPFMKHLAFGQIRWKAKLQLILSDWHKLIGIVTLVFNLVLGLTGAVLGLENLQRFSPPMKEALHPAPSKAAKDQKPDNIKNRLTVDQAIEKAREAIPGFYPLSVNLPRADRAHWMLRGNIEGYFAAANTSWIMLDTHTGAVIEKHDARAARPVTKAYNLSEPLHFGDFAGIPLKVLYCLFGIVSGLLYITGFMIWILKMRKSKPKDKPNKPAKAPVLEAPSSDPALAAQSTVETVNTR